ncbi:MAG: family 2A encapsulin nanocompartment cargo protein cysteine desulfurase [Chitinophagaceae bacterium]
MSTNINSHIPDTALIERLANELFSQTPGTPASQVSGTQHTPEKDSPNIPASVAGSGVSPSAINQRNAVDLNDPITSLQDPNIPTANGSIPQSVAGSGIAPSFQSLQSNIPLSNGGSTRSTVDYGNFAQTNSQYDTDNPLPNGHFGFTEDNFFQKELNEALNGIASYIPSGQLPVSGVGSPSQYYFAPGFSEVESYFSKDQSWQNFAGQTSLARPAFNLNVVRNDFPILSETINGRPLVWLDNAATTQKPRQVIDRLSQFYLHENSNIHRAAHTLAARATDAYEEARETVRRFINAQSVNEIVFVRGTTEAINLIAQSWGDQYLNEGDEIIVSHLEHHANIVPWQLLAQKKGIKLKVIPVDDNGELLLDEYAKLLSSRTKLVSVTAVSNALGTVTPIKQIIELGHQSGAKVLVDAAQSISHIPTDVQWLDADWLVFSGHKIYAPTGIGVVYGKENLLNATQPWQGGGNMIKDVTFEQTQYNPAPTKFEAGTGNIADAVGLGAALQYVSKVGIEAIHQYETALIHYASARLRTIPGLHIIGNAKEKAGAISFVLDGFETPKVGSLLGRQGIAVRAGHHCAQPILRRFGLEATVRPSFAFYNTCADIDALVDGINGIREGKFF